MTANETRSHEESSSLPRLEDCYLYAIASPADLAARLKSSVSVLEQWAHDPHAYKIWTTKEGRKIQEPKPTLQRLHGRVHKLLARVQTPNYLHSSVKSRSYITNARDHISGAPAIKLDLKKFFPSVTRHALFKFFVRRMRCAPDAAGLLSRLLTCDDHLPTGSRASSILAYYAHQDMFDELNALAVQRGLLMTCYVDDITITGVGSSSILIEARRIIAAHGLRSHKVKSFPLRRPRIITGVVVNPAGIRLQNRRHRKIQEQYEALNSARSDEEKLAMLPSLISRLHEAAQIEPKSWVAKAKDLEKMRRELKLRLKSTAGSP